MRVVLRVVESHPSLQIPAIIVDIAGRTGTKYIINAPSQTNRYLGLNNIALGSQNVYLFTKTMTDTIAGLPCLMYSNIAHFEAPKNRIYGDSKLSRYLEQLRYKMGFGIACFSYCSWEGVCVKGISDKRIIKNIANSEDFAHKFNNLNTQIQNHVNPRSQNNALLFYDPLTKIYEDEHMRIQLMQLGSPQKQITNFMFELKKSQTSSSEPNTFWILHHSDLATLSELKQNSVFLSQLTTKTAISNTIVHLFQDEKMSIQPEFIAFIKQFPRETSHLIVSNSVKNKNEQFLDFLSRYKHIQLIGSLSYFYQRYFSNLLEKQKKYALSMWKQAKSLESLFGLGNVLRFKGQAQYVLTPQSNRGFCQKQITANDPLQLSQSHSITKKVQVPSRESIAKIVEVCDPKVTFLGTASSFSTALRNVSSILVEIQDVLILWDCGAGSYLQFLNHFGSETQQKLLKTEVLFITHCHSDHILGLMQFISKRNMLKNEKNFKKLFLIVPSNMVPWFHRYSEIIQDLSEGCEILFVQSLIKYQQTHQSESFERQLSKAQKQINKRSKCMKTRNSDDLDIRAELDLQISFEFYKQEWSEIIKRYQQKQKDTLDVFRVWMKDNKIKGFKPIPVFHCPQAFGIVLQHTSGVKISYSGDTRPWPAFAKAAMNSTLLIHEATFNDSDIRNANDYYHSTVSEAIEIGMKSRSWKTALTHFSQHSFKAGEMIDLKTDPNWKKKDYAEKHTFLCCDHLETHLSEMEPLPSVTKLISRQIVRLEKESRK